jgi:hypothetical protein
VLYQGEISFGTEDEIGEEYVRIAESKYAEPDSTALGSQTDGDMEEKQAVSRAPFDAMCEVGKKHPCEDSEILDGGY